MVERRNIDPIDMKPFLSNLFICHRTADGYVYDLVGTTVCTAHDREITGKYLQNVISPQRYADVKDVFDWVTDGGAAYHEGRLGAPGREHVHFKRLYLPLTYGPDRGIIGLNEYISKQNCAERTDHSEWVALIRIADGEVERRVPIAPLSSVPATGTLETKSLPSMLTGQNSEVLRR
jgi:hypothetical protein